MKITKETAERAILHLSTLGDTDIFPPPFEFQFFKDEGEKIVDAILKMDADKFSPTSCFECLSPKGQLSFRIAHQLFPTDTLLYTAAAIEIAPAIEALKPPISEGGFAYRFVEEDANPRLFSAASNFHDWLIHVREMYDAGGPFSDVKYVIETDISDFYARIYFHRLEHVLDDCEASNDVRKIIEGVIKFSRARQSYGLPVGTAASRILAEGLLIDTDQMISDGASAYTRYVDDFRIVVDHQAEVHSTLCKIAEHLMLTEGLSLNASKTRTFTTSEGSEYLDDKLSDVFNDDELVRLNHYIKAVYDDEDVSIEDIEDVDYDAMSAKIAEVKARQNIDYTAIKVILKAMRAVDCDDPVTFISNNSEFLYYVPRDFCILIGGLAQRYPDCATKIAELLTEIVSQPPYKDMALSRIWVAHLFVTQALPITSQLRQTMNLNGTIIERRQDLLLRGILRDRAHFRAQKTKFDEANAWEKGALMLGASCLPSGEYETWLNTIKDHVTDPFGEIYRKWLIKHQSEMVDKLKENYLVKTKAEKIAEMFEDLSEDDRPF